MRRGRRSFGLGGRQTKTKTLSNSVFAMWLKKLRHSSSSQRSRRSQYQLPYSAKDKSGYGGFVNGKNCKRRAATGVYGDIPGRDCWIGSRLSTVHGVPERSQERQPA